MKVETYFARKMLDIENFIIEVEQRPCLWRAWEEVAENCFEDWNNLTNEDKNNKSK